MSIEQIQGIIRHVIGAAGAFFIATGHADEDLVSQAGGALAAITAVIWSVVSKLRR